MCGIFAYLNYFQPQDRKTILQFLLNGLRRLEYRGYDSAGLAIDGDNGKCEILRMTGNVSQLDKLVEEENSNLDKTKILSTHVAIAHTRWATHGKPCERNSHPHSSDANREFVVVHNGIITNYSQLKTMLINHGFEFQSDTDTEVIVKLCKYFFDQEPTLTFTKLFAKVATVLQGAYAVVLKSSHFPNEAIASKIGSPLIMGIKSNKQNPGPGVEYFLASDVMAIVEHTKTVIYLEDLDMIHFRQGKFSCYNLKTGKDLELERALMTLNTELDSINKGEFAHFMLKEIYEQQESVVNTIRGRVDFEKGTVHLGGIRSHLDDLRRTNRLIFIGCGTSYHSAVAARSIVEELTQSTVTVELASDFLDRKPPVYRNDTAIFISQSGETADTLRALEYCKSRKALCVGITNTVGSAIARDTDCGIYLNCGPEIGVASTKAYTSQIIAIVLFALAVGSDRSSSLERRKEIIRGLEILPDLIRQALAMDAEVKSISETMYTHKSLLIMGRGYQYATCLEAALKIKELSYMHCEGILAGELKHGTLALVDETMPILLIATKDALYDKLKSSLSQVTARSGKPIILYNEEDAVLSEKTGLKLRVPAIVDCLQSIVNIIPLQLMAYHIAVLRGFNVDQPRNLAKSVTVE